MFDYSFFVLCVVSLILTKYEYILYDIVVDVKNLVYEPRCKIVDIFHTMGKISDKINDILYKDKWDRSCLNPVLAADAEAQKAVNEKANALQNFQNQINARNEKIMQPVTPIQMFQPQVAMAGAPMAVKMNSIMNISPSEQLPPSIMSDFVKQPIQEAPPVIQVVMPAVQSYNVQEEPQVAPPIIVQEEAVQTVETEDVCYYVRIKHTKTFPEKGSVVIMRSCDHEYAWTDAQPESEVPICGTCKCCGKKVDYIDTEME